MKKLFIGIIFTLLVFGMRAQCTNDTVTLFPWENNFGRSYDCWHSFDSNSTMTLMSMVSTSAAGNDTTWYVMVTRSYFDSVTIRAFASPALLLPADTGLQLHWRMRRNSGNTSWLVLVSTTQRDDINAYDTLVSGSTTSSGWINYTADLSAYGGQTVYLAFCLPRQYGTRRIDVTDVAVYSDQMPMLTLSDVEPVMRTGDTSSYTATLTQGSDSALVYTWHSTLLGESHVVSATPGSTSDTWDIVYTLPGFDTITVNATNPWGTYTCIRTAMVVSCDTIDTFPWSINFESQHGIWEQCWSANGWSRNNANVTIRDENGNRRSLTKSLKSQHTGERLVVSPIHVPTGDAANHLALWLGFMGNIDILISTDGYDADSLFTDTVFSWRADRNTWHMRTIDLQPYAGQTIYAAIVNQTTGLAQWSSVNYVAVAYDTRPSITLSGRARTITDSTEVFTTQWQHGLGDSLHYLWHSTMADAGLAAWDDSITYPDSLLGSTGRITYFADGYDTVMVVAVNPYGTDTATATLQVFDCTPVTTLPWTETFALVTPASPIACWYVPEGSNWATGISPITQVEAHRCVFSDAVSDTMDGWLVSRAIVLPEVTDIGLQLDWDASTSDNTFRHSYSVLVTANSDYSDLSSYTTLYVDTMPLAQQGANFWTTYTRRSVDITAWAGQTVRVAFRNQPVHWTSGSKRLFLDNVTVRTSDVPVVELSAPTILIDNEATYTATLVEGVTTNLAYTWHSSLMDTTWVDYNSNSRQSTFNLTYTSAGNDTITVVATNIYGADTAMAVVEVTGCGYQTIPWSENFEGVTATAYNVAGSLPQCWYYTWNGSNAAYAPHVIADTGYQFLSNLPDNALFMVAGSSTGYGNMATVTLPWMADSLQTLSLALDYRYESATYGTLIVGYCDEGGSFTAVDTLPGHTGSYEHAVVSFEGATIPDARIMLRWNCPSVYYAVAIDNLRVFHDQTIPAPVVGVDHIWTTRARVWWDTMPNATGYRVIVAAAGIDSVVAGNVSSITIGGLTALTSYTVRVAGFVGNDTSYYGIANFTTACSILNMPYNETFSGVATGSLPYCWILQWAGSANYAPRVNSDHRFVMRAGGTMWGAEYAADSYVTLPNTPMSLNRYYLSLQYINIPSSGELRIGYRTGGTFVPIDTLTVFHSNDTISLANMPDGVNQLTFNWHESSTVSEAGIEITRLSIFGPLIANVDSVGVECVKLSWNSLPNATSYHVVMANPALDTVVSAFDTVITLCGLTANTQYTARVAAIEGTDTTSYTPITFSTLCSIITPPYFDDFESYTALPACWYHSANTGYNNIINGWTAYCHSGTRALRLQTSNQSYLVATPPINAPADELLVSFWTSWTGIYSDSLLAGVMTSLNDPSSFVPLLRLEPTEDVTRYEFDTRSIDADRVQIAFYVTGSEFGNILVDDLNIEHTTPCARPRNVEAFLIDAQHVDIQWGYDSVSTLPIEGAVLTLFDLTASDSVVYYVAGSDTILSGLIAGHSYRASLSTVCDTLFSRSVNLLFTAAAPECVAPVVTAVADSNSADLTWRRQGGEEYWVVEYRVGGAPTWLVADTVIPAHTIATYTLTGLIPTTLYQVRVTNHCAGGSMQSGTVFVTTLCGLIGLPYRHNFATGYEGCWQVPSGLVQNSPWYPGASMEDWMFHHPILSPEVNRSLNNVEIHYTVQGHDYYHPVVKVGVSDAGGANPLWLDSSVVLGGSHELSLYLNGFTGSQRHIIFNGDFQSYLIEVRIEEINACVPVAHVGVHQLTDTTALLQWEPAAEENAWAVYLDGTLQGITTTPSFALNGLTASTSYTAAVRAICAAADTSVATTATFTTACSQASLPWNEDFTAYDYTVSSFTATCWRLYLRASDTYARATINRTGIADNYMHLEDYGLFYDNPAGIEYNYVVSPLIDPQGHHLHISFQGVMTFYQNTPGNSTLGIVTDITDTSTFIPLLDFEEALNLNTYSNYQVNTDTLVPAAVFNQPVALAFRWRGVQVECNIDNINVTVSTLPLTPDTVWRTVEVASSDTSLGIVTGGGVYADSSLVTITALPNSAPMPDVHYEFDHWNDGNTINPRQLMVVSDTAFVAYFRVVNDTTIEPPDTVWRTVIVSSNDESLGIVTGGGVYLDSSIVTLVAQPLTPPTTEFHVVFDRWDNGDTTNPRQLMVVSDTAFVAYFRVIDDTVGIAQAQSADLLLVPNPARQRVEVAVSGMTLPVKLQLFGVDGRCVLERTLTFERTMVDLSHLSSGTYYARVTHPAVTVVRKLLIAH